VSLQEEGCRTDKPYVSWRTAALMHLRIGSVQSVERANEIGVFLLRHRLKSKGPLISALNQVHACPHPNETPKHETWYIAYASRLRSERM